MPPPAVSLRRTLVSTAAATTCGVLPAFLLGSQAPQIGADLGLDVATIGAVVACAWAAAAVGSAPFGRLAERVGGDRMLRAAALASAAVQLCIAAAAHSPLSLALLVAAGGLVNSAAQPSANLVIAHGVAVERHGLAFAVKQSAIPFATFVGGLAVPTVALTIGWRWSYVIGAAVAVLAALAVPTTRAGRRDGDRANPGAPSTARPRTRPDPGLLPLVVLASGVGLGAAAAGALATFLTTAATESGVAESAAGLLLTVGSAIGITVRLSMGARADRVGGGQLGTVATMMGLGALAFAGFALDASWTYVALTPLAFGAGWSWPGLFNLSVVRAYPGRPGAATGATQTGTYLGAGGGPLLVGWIAEHHPWSVAWAVTAALAACAALAVLAGRAALRRRRDPDHRPGTAPAAPSPRAD